MKLFSSVTLIQKKDSYDFIFINDISSQFFITNIPFYLLEDVDCAWIWFLFLIKVRNTSNLEFICEDSVSDTNAL